MTKKDNENKEDEQQPKLKRKKPITQKKISSNKVIGTRNLVDTQTGEEINTTETVSGTQDINFHKVWLFNLIQTLDILGGKKIKVVNYILDNLDDSTNVLIATQREIAQKSGVSLQTVSSTMKKLVDSNFLQKRTGVYMVNPDILVKGKNPKRQYLLMRFEQFPNEDTSSEGGNEE